MQEFFRGWKRTLGVATLGYFNPWRRKIGVVTLVMACVFAAMWVRSLTITDVVMIRVNNNALEAWRFRAGWLRSQQGRIQRIASLATGRHGKPVGPSGVFLWQIPYWSITLPFAALSAWLLLSKPWSVEYKEKLETD